MWCWRMWCWLQRGSQTALNAVQCALERQCGHTSREHRFKFENVVLVGVIPGPKEPKGVINNFLGPMVNELLEFWHGCNISGSFGSIGL